MWPVYNLGSDKQHASVRAKTLALLCIVHLHIWTLNIEHTHLSSSRMESNSSLFITPDTMDVDSPNAKRCHLRPITPPQATLEELINKMPALKCLLHSTWAAQHVISYTAYNMFGVFHCVLIPLQIPVPPHLSFFVVSCQAIKYQQVSTKLIINSRHMKGWKWWHTEFFSLCFKVKINHNCLHFFLKHRAQDKKTLL